MEDLINKELEDRSIINMVLLRTGLWFQTDHLGWEVQLVEGNQERPICSMCKPHSCRTPRTRAPKTKTPPPLGGQRDAATAPSSCPLTLQRVGSPHSWGHAVTWGTKLKTQEPGTRSLKFFSGVGGWGAWWLQVAGVAQVARAADASGLGL